MQTTPKRSSAFVLCLSLLCLCLLFMTSPGFSMNQAKSRVASANGTGTLKVGSEEFQITSIVVKLMENGKAEVTIITEIQVFLSGTWTRKTPTSNEIALRFSGEATASSFEGDGKLLLRVKNEKVIDKLTLHGQARTSQRMIDLNFVAE